MKFGFWFDYDQTFTFVALFREIRRRQPEAEVTGYVVNDRYWSHAVDGLPAGSALVRFYDRFAEGLAYAPTADELIEFRAWDERHNLARIAYSDRHLTKFTHDQLISLFVFLAKEFRGYLRREKPDAFIFNCIASQYAHLFYLILVEEKVRVLIPTAFGVENLFYLADNPYFEARDVWQTYRSYLAATEHPPKQTVEWAQSYMARIRGSSPAYSNAAVALEQSKFGFPGPAAGLRYLYNHARYYRNDPTLPSIREKVIDVVRLKRNRARLRHMFAAPATIAGRDFVYFPLHYEPEIATLILSQFDQRSVIDIVTRQMPLTWKLVVKEHPAMLGQRDPAFFEEIKRRYPNVVLIDPGVSSFLLASEARAVLTLNGTVTLETLILRKPAIFLSNARFGGFGLGTMTHDLINFGAVLSAALANVPTDHELTAMLASIHRHCRRYEFAEPLGRPSVLDNGNIGALADAVLDKLEFAQGVARTVPGKLRPAPA